MLLFQIANDISDIEESAGYRIFFRYLVYPYHLRQNDADDSEHREEKVTFIFEWLAYHLAINALKSNNSSSTLCVAPKKFSQMFRLYNFCQFLNITFDLKVNKILLHIL